MIEFIVGLIVGVISTVIVKDWLDVRRANEIRDNNMALLRMEHRIWSNVNAQFARERAERK